MRTPTFAHPEAALHFLKWNYWITNHPNDSPSWNSRPAWIGHPISGWLSTYKTYTKRQGLKHQILLPVGVAGVIVVILEFSVASFVRLDVVSGLTVADIFVDTVVDSPVTWFPGGEGRERFTVQNHIIILQLMMDKHHSPVGLRLDLLQTMWPYY